MTKAHPTSLDFAEALNNKFAGDEKFAEYYGAFAVIAGQKYDKIIIDRNGSRSVHAFMERSTEKLIKAAGWQAPQKDKNGLAYRYDLNTPDSFEKAVTMADPFGSYLYAR